MKRAIRSSLNRHDAHLAGIGIDTLAEELTLAFLKIEPEEVIRIGHASTWMNENGDEVYVRDVYKDDDKGWLVSWYCSRTGIGEPDTPVGKFTDTLLRFLYTA